MSVSLVIFFFLVFFFFKQKTAYEMRISDWSSDVCSSDLKFQQEVGGNLRGGNPGQQLFAVGATQTYFHDVPAAFTPAGDGYRVLALHLHFGGDELSSRAEPIRERSIDRKSTRLNSSH